MNFGKVSSVRFFCSIKTSSALRMFLFHFGPCFLRNTWPNMEQGVFNVEGGPLSAFKIHYSAN
ncbi:MAG: hypothetical protein JWQ30_2748 [Sediminibacterium sp.]|nr:hypothetical protein [Sediminibacterium sp.]